MYKAPIRYSGYRISLLPEAQQRAAWEQRLTDIQWVLPHLHDALAEPFFTDDSVVDLPFDMLVRLAMEGGELFGCTHEREDGTIVPVGFVLLRDIRPGRDAWMEGYTVPEFRGKYPCSKQLRQIMDYAFRPWNPELTQSQKLTPKGLGLIKLKANVSVANRAAQMALWRCGFQTTGISPRDGLFKGQVTDIITVEKFNPLYLPQGNNNVRKQESREATSTADVRGTTGIQSSAAVQAAELRPEGERPEQVRSEGPERERDSGVGSRRRSGKRPKQLRERVAQPQGIANIIEEHGGSSEQLPSDGATGRGSTKRRVRRK